MNAERCMPEERMRARGQARRLALLDAAAKLFKEKGYEKTSLTDLVKEAGGSRASVYEYFGDKEGLLRAMLDEHADRILTDLAALRPDPAMSPDEALKRMGLRFVTGLMDDEAMAILRILIVQGGRMPEVAEFFFKRGPDSVADRTAEYLLELARSGKLWVDDPHDAARAFIGMIIGDVLLRRLVLPGFSISRKEIENHVNRSVQVFLMGARPRDS